MPIGIGENIKIRNCVIDKNAKIENNVLITNKDGVQEAARSEKATIRDGTVR